MLGVVIKVHEETFSLAVAFTEVMPRGEEIQEWIQALIEKVKALHECQHLMNMKQHVRCCEKRSHMQHAKNDGKKDDNQGDGDYSGEKFSNSGLFLVRHLSSFDPSNN